MTSAHPILYRGGFSSGSFYEREANHRRIIMENCCSVQVSPGEIAATINSDGEVDLYKAADLVFALIGRARDEAVRRTLGVPATDQEVRA